MEAHVARGGLILAAIHGSQPQPAKELKLGGGPGVIGGYMGTIAQEYPA
jgi:hypothetical protein